jgi:acetyl-CoA carboxylase biotin carboxyl carrier protein
MAKKKSSAKAESKVAASPSSSPMDVGLLEQIVKLMSANDLNTVDLRDGGKRVILRRGPVAGPMSYAMPTAAMMAPAASYQPQAPASASQGSAAGAAAEDDEAGLVPIKSEMVGTFYASPKPGAKPFVNIGSQVIKDETDVAILEAMKTFNTMKSSVTGTIAKVLAQDGQSVQFDQPLFLVKP